MPNGFLRAIHCPRVRGESRRVCPRLESPLAGEELSYPEPGSSRHECDLVSAILDTAATLVVVLDGRGRIVRFNRLCQQLTGYTPRVLGKPFCELLIVPEEQARVRRLMLESPTVRRAEPEEVHWRTKDGISGALPGPRLNCSTRREPWSTPWAPGRT